MKIGLVSGDWVHPLHTHDNKERWGGSGWVRIAQYIEHLPQYEWITGTLIFDNGVFVVRTAAESYEYCPMIFMHRLMHNGLAEHVAIARSNGQIVLNDIDDWYWGLDPSNAAFKATHPKFNNVENRNNYRSILANSDLVIVSTPYLASRLTWLGKTPMTVVKNTVDIQRFTMWDHVEEECPTIGWVGSTAHRSSDLETMRGILSPLAHRGEFKLHHSGDNPHADSFASRIGVPKGMVSTLPMADHEDYPGILKFDIGIVPLRVTPFNQAKSDIKGLEYAAAGIPFVAQKIDAYSELNETGVGRIAHRPADWIKHLRALKDPVVRSDEAARNREILDSRDIRHGVKVMQEILDSFF